MPNQDLTLYGITQEMDALEGLLISQGGEIDEDTEELSKQVQVFLEKKVDGCVGFIEKQKDLIKLAKEKKKDLDSFMKTKQNIIDNFSEYVKMCIERTGNEKFQGTMCEIKLRKPSRKVEIFDADKIPVQFIEVVPASTSIKKSEIKKALEDGEVPGAKLIDGKTSVIFGSAK